MVLFGEEFNFNCVNIWLHLIYLIRGLHRAVPIISMCEIHPMHHSFSKQEGFCFPFLYYLFKHISFVLPFPFPEQMPKVAFLTLQGSHLEMDCPQLLRSRHSIGSCVCMQKDGFLVAYNSFYKSEMEETGQGAAELDLLMHPKFHFGFRMGGRSHLQYLQSCKFNPF